MADEGRPAHCTPAVMRRKPARHSVQLGLDQVEKFLPRNALGIHLGDPGVPERLARLLLERVELQLERRRLLGRLLLLVEPCRRRVSRLGRRSKEPVTEKTSWSWKHRSGPFRPTPPGGRRAYRSGVRKGHASSRRTASRSPCSSAPPLRARRCKSTRPRIGPGTRGRGSRRCRGVRGTPSCRRRRRPPRRPCP